MGCTESEVSETLSHALHTVAMRWLGLWTGQPLKSRQTVARSVPPATVLYSCLLHSPTYQALLASEFVAFATYQGSKSLVRCGGFQPIFSQC